MGGWGGGAALLFGAVLSVATELGSADTHYTAQHNRLKERGVGKEKTGKKERKGAILKSFIS